MEVVYGDKLVAVALQVVVVVPFYQAVVVQVGAVEDVFWATLFY